MLGALGGAAGLLSGSLVGISLDWGLHLYLEHLGVPPTSLFTLSPLTAVAIGGSAVLISLLAGIPPARHAARIEPAEALRNAV